MAQNDIDERLARLEGQYHALSRDLNDKLKELHNMLEKVQKGVENMDKVKGGGFRNQSLGDVVKRVDQEVQEMHQQVIAISNALQVKS
jgi:predicted  nucleic acid-binding Zn-ribbon protein